MRRLISTLACCLLLTACQTNNPKTGTQGAGTPKTVQNVAGSQQGSHPNAPKTQRVEQTQPAPTYDQSPQATADRLIKLANRVKNVKKSTAVVLGKYAIVAIDVDEKLDRPEVGVVKYSVAEALKEDPQGATALVTADADLRQRLVEVQADMQNGRPVAGIMEELADITGRLIPQFPSDVRQKVQQPSQNRQQPGTRSQKPGAKQMKRPEKEPQQKPAQPYMNQ
ncbi:YhcN/YlaJ family sporulation lipoprotein [Brevibacillus laterosporus]|uniref:YhcN/YlaJ family sporulation lipoprotein n=1 Tax=Brevibacillus laterosporus TaxID=1465 RepID=A0AAP8QDM1_BRELA|nr:YhcN/YlaJ family sporulation lipoprotein [Brevibacillus laterosporus]MCR8980317.1 YhcN/YlaJ family sporulation lipoprotein [Brevibacillus laterosporus]MCZ0807472.1 YhcN/YlaJ family sporulation lipoprotein [Brevibacillus laterosporus]MCZ0825908.1 YhcN/YlaJ family sporulation lipoprotein [Brevibacillus laterosporus]MCZ0849594.1 YhcN/YlaJ family sporulation lipoprotein [Brevibacillus laterosporus]PPB02981.1 YhcN/YlaJ family sporulation lipoprotein [Brevibacillus laterosporus]